MVTPFLGLVYKSGTGETTPIIKRYSAADVNSVGVNFGTFDTATSVQNMPVNRIVRFGGLNTFLATVHDQVLRSTNGGNSWTVVLTTNVATTNSICKTGLNVLYINGRPAVCGTYKPTASNWSGFFSYDGVTWTTQTDLITYVASSGATISSEVVFNNNLYFVLTDSGTPRVFRYDPGAGGLSIISTGGATSGSLALGVFNNRLFCISWFATNTWVLQEIVGDTITTIDSNVPGGSGTAGAGFWPTIFSDATNMYVLMPRSDSNFAYQFNSSLTKSNITSTVFPTVLSTGRSTARFATLVDNQRSPGSTPDIFVYYAVDGSTSSWAVYQWQGNASVMTLVDVGGSTSQALPFNTNSTGAYFFLDSSIPSTASTYGEITGRTFTSTGVELSFKIYGSSSGMNFRAWYGEETDEYPTNAAALSNPSVGSISGGTINTGLTANDGATTYRVTWTPPGTITQNDRFRLIGEFFFA